MPEENLERHLLETYSTREQKLHRIRAIERRLEKMEGEDETNDPELIRGHIRLTRGCNMGCAGFFMCLVVASASVWQAGRAEPQPRHGWALGLVILFGLVTVTMFLRGFLYRPDPGEIADAYEPWRNRPEYREIVLEMEILARALSQDLRSEDADGA